MATAYAFPMNASAGHEHHGFGHARTHNRKNTLDRLPLQPLSSNGGLGGGLKREPADSHLQSPLRHSHSHSAPQKSLAVANHQRFLSNAQTYTEEQPSSKTAGSEKESGDPWIVTPAEQPGNEHGFSHDIMISSHNSHSGHKSSGSGARWVVATGRNMWAKD